MLHRRSCDAAGYIRKPDETAPYASFSPFHVVVNRDGDVVYFSARNGKYLEHGPGLPTRQLITMARKGLRLDLRAVFREAVENGRTAVRDEVAV